MSGKTKIEWCDKVWNPVTGCSPVSAGCDHCYAARMAKRLAGRCGYPKDDPFKVTVHEDRLEDPFHWKKPARVFVNSMGDLFHEDVPDNFIDKLFVQMYEYPDHTFLVLTKRPERMLSWINDWIDGLSNPNETCPPLPNLWLGVTAENQAMADERIPLLLETPAAVRFVSVEPMLGPVDIGMSTATCQCCDRWDSRWVRLNRAVRSDIPGDNTAAVPGIYRAESNRHGALSVNTKNGLLGIKPDEFDALPKLDWVICGGETGPGARPMDPSWVGSLQDQCSVAGVPFFFKGWGGKIKNRILDGREWNEFPGMNPPNPPSEAAPQGGQDGGKE